MSAAPPFVLFQTLVGGAKSPPVSLTVPEELRNNYHLEGIVGHGSFGMVMRARRNSDGRTVAVKFLALGASEDERTRFRQECQLQARVRHESVTKVYDGGVGDGFAYLVMEYLPGGTLEGRLAHRGPFPPKDAVAIVAACLDGLAACHELGIVHRDIKPANILFDADGHAQLSDFGTATAAGLQGAITRTGALIGTPAYMAPEQAAGDPTGPAADIYAMGLVLYELLAGRRPLDQDQVVLFLRKRIEGSFTPLAVTAPYISSTLASAAERALAPRPLGRYPTATAMAEALRAALRPDGRATSPPPRQSKKSRTWVPFAILIGLGLGAFVLRYQPKAIHSPSSGDALLSLAEAELIAGQMEKARGHCRLALAQDPQFARAYFVLGTVQFQAGLFREAAALFREAVAKDPTFPLALFALGRVTSALGRSNEAGEMMARAAAQDATGFCAAGWAIAMAETGRVEAALHYLAEKLKVAPSNPFLLSRHGYLLARKGRLADGERTLRRVQAEPHHDGFVDWALGYTLIRQGRLDEAIRGLVARAKRDPGTVGEACAVLRPLVDDGSASAAETILLALDVERWPHLEGRVQLFRAVLRNGNVTRLQALIRRWLAADPHDAFLPLKMAWCAFEVRHWNLVTYLGQVVMNRSPGDNEAAYYVLHAMLQLNHIGQAAACARSLAKRPITDQRLLNTLLAVVERSPTPQMALPLLEVLHATRPRDVSIAGRLAWAQLQLDKKLACAQTLARGLAVDPEDSLLLTIKAQLFIAQKQFDLSEAVFHRLIALHPTSSTAQFAWAYYLETRGRREEAVKAVREAFHVDPQLGQKLAPRMEVRTQPGIVSVLLPQLQLLDRAGLHLPWVPIQLTRAYLLTGAKEKALATAREGVRLHPRDPLVARNYLEQLEKLGKVDEMLQFLQTAPKDVAISLGKRKWR